MRLVIELKRDALPEGRAEQALQAHGDADDVRRQHRRARRRRPADAVAARGPRRLRRPPARGRRPPRQARARPQKEARAHVLEGLLIALDNLDAIIALIRGSRRPRRGPRRARWTRFGSQPDPGHRDPRPAPGPADRARVRTRSRASTPTSPSASASCASCSATRQRVLSIIKEELDGDPRALRRRAPHGDHGQRGRDRHRGPDRRPADGHHDHADRLHQVAAARDLPPAAARRRRRDRDGHEGRRLHRAPLRVLVARLPAVLLQPRQGLPLEGLRAARGVAHGEGPRAGQRPAAARGRADPVRARRRATSTRPKYLVFATRKGTVKKTEFLAYNTPIKADGIIAINIRDDDELVAVRRVDPGDEILMVSRAGLAVRFEESRRARDGPRHRPACAG